MKRDIHDWDQRHGDPGFDFQRIGVEVNRMVNGLQMLRSDFGVK